MRHNAGSCSTEIRDNIRETNLREVRSFTFTENFTITEKNPNRAFSWLKALKLRGTSFAALLLTVAAGQGVAPGAVLLADGAVARPREGHPLRAPEGDHGVQPRAAALQPALHQHPGRAAVDLCAGEVLLSADGPRSPWHCGVSPVHCLLRPHTLVADPGQNTIVVTPKLPLVSGQLTPHHVSVAALVARHGLEARVLEADLPVLGRHGGGAADPCRGHSSYLLSTLYLQFLQ